MESPAYNSYLTMIRQYSFFSLGLFSFSFHNYCSINGLTAIAKSVNHSVECCASATFFSLAKLIARSQLKSHARISLGALFKGLRALRYISRASCLCLASLTPSCSVRFEYHCLIFSVGLQAVHQVLTRRFEYPILEFLDGFPLFVVLSCGPWHRYFILDLSDRSDLLSDVLFYFGT